jgi:hypothetical protein
LSKSCSDPYYDCYCYLPLYVFCGRHLLAAKLRRSNIDASAGALEEVARTTGHICTRWPRVPRSTGTDSGGLRACDLAYRDAAADFGSVGGHSYLKSVQNCVVKR